jgi:hypothetical protein
LILFSLIMRLEVKSIHILLHFLHKFSWLPKGHHYWLLPGI